MNQLTFYQDSEIYREYLSILDNQPKKQLPEPLIFGIIKKAREVDFVGGTEFA